MPPRDTEYHIRSNTMMIRLAFVALIVIKLTATLPAAEDLPARWNVAPPDRTPQVFLPGVVSQDGRFEQNMTITPNGREIYFTVTDVGWTSCQIVGLRWTEEMWAPFDVPDVLMTDSYETEPRLSPDGNHLYFVSTRPAAALDEDGGGTAIWMADRDGGGWTPPRKLALLSKVWHPSVTASGRLYFLSYADGGHGEGDIYHADFDATDAPLIANVGPVINSAAADADPFISPDESILIFDSPREGGFGAWDLYVSFKDATGAWSTPVNLGPGINTADVEFGASLSPDGRHLFFSRRASDNSSGDIYWVDARILDDLRPAESQRATTTGANSETESASHR